MSYYLARHGKAYSIEEDPTRGLTDKGVKKTHKIAKLLAKKSLNISMIVHSGKKRAEQTALIFAKTLGLENKVEVVDGILPNDDVKKFSLVLPENTLIVGHLPFLEMLTNYLVAGNFSSHVVDYATSQVVCLEKDSLQKFHVDWLIK